MKNNKSVSVLLMAGGLVLSPATGAATLAQMQQLDAATPPGSRIVCERNYPAREATPAFRDVTTGVVTAREGNRTEYQVELADYPAGSSTPFSLVRFTQVVTLGENAQTVTIDPASLSVSLHGATADEESQLLERIRRDTPTTIQDPYSKTEFTTFPDHVVKEPGFPPGYCRVKTADRA